MTAPALPEDVEKALSLFRTAVEVYGAEDGGFRRIDPRETALRAAIAAHTAPPVAPTVEAALAALDVEDELDGYHQLHHTTIVGLDDVRAAHRAEVARVVAERNDAQKRLAAAIIDATDAAARVAKLEAALRGLSDALDPDGTLVHSGSIKALRALNDAQKSARAALEDKS